MPQFFLLFYGSRCPFSALFLHLPFPFCILQCTRSFLPLSSPPWVPLPWWFHAYLCQCACSGNIMSCSSHSWDVCKSSWPSRSSDFFQFCLIFQVSLFHMLCQWGKTSKHCSQGFRTCLAPASSPFCCLFILQNLSLLLLGVTFERVGKGHIRLCSLFSGCWQFVYLSLYLRVVLLSE